MTQLTTKSLVAAVEAKGHISHGFGRWTFREGNVTQVTQKNFARHFLILKYFQILSLC